MVSVVIPNYNGKHFLNNCIQSLKQQTYKDIEIIIVDNNSSDGSIEFLKENYPEIEVIQLVSNTGFSYAVNIGIKFSKSDYVFLLNNDTEVDEFCIEMLVDCISDAQDCFSINAKMIQFNNRDILDDAGDEYSAFGIAFKRGWNKRIESENKVRRIFSSCAGASLYKKEVFKEIGYFDETFFAYFEDVDIGYRANIYGYNNYYTPDAIVYHVVSGTSGNKITEFKTMLSARNNIFIIYKNMPFIQIIFNMPLLFLGIMLKINYFAKYGYGRVFIIETWKAILRCRELEKVKYKKKNIYNYINIQVRLMRNCFCFVYNTYIK